MECVLRMFIVWGLVWLFVWGSLWQHGNKHCEVQNFILYTWHMFSRWHIRPACSEHWCLSIFPLLLQDLYRGIKEIHVMCLLAGSDSLLHVGICYGLLPALYCLRHPNRCKSVSQYCKPTCGLRQHYGCKIMDRLAYCPDFTPSDFCFSGSLKQHLAGKWLQQMQTWSKLSPPGCRQMTTVSFI